MISVLALPLDEAVSRLGREGYAVETVEARSMKGVEAADSLRVIRQAELNCSDKPTMRIVYSAFRTSVYLCNEQ